MKRRGTVTRLSSRHGTMGGAAAILLVAAVAGLQALPLPAASATPTTTAAAATPTTTAAAATPATTAAAVSGPAYSIQDLGVFPDGGVDTYATGINDAGDVTGYGDHATPGFSAFRWQAGTLSDLGSLGCSAYGRAINGSDTVVGSYGCTLSGGFQTSASGTSADIGSLFAEPTTADAVNADGQIAGASTAADGSGRAYVSGPGGAGLQAIDSIATEPPGSRTLEAFAVNDAGDAAGIASFFSAACGSHDGPFLFAGGVVQDLTGAGSCAGQATAVNDSDQVVGYEELASGADHAFLWNGTTEDLGTPNPGLAESAAYGINAGGTIVGDAQGSPESYPLAWVEPPGGAMALLNDLVDPSLGWDVMHAAAVNDHGQIVGWGAHDGGYHAFEMTPIPTVPVTLTSITVSPATPTLPKGVSQQFIAVGTYSDGSTADLTGAVTWSSSAPNADPIGSGGLFTGDKQGRATVTATDGPVSGSTTVTVGPRQLVSVAIEPATTSAPPGATVQFTATGTYTDGSTRDLTTKGTWKSSATKVASIGAGTGLATTKKNGVTTITFLKGKLSPATASLTVTNQVSE